MVFFDGHKKQYKELYRSCVNETHISTDLWKTSSKGNKGTNVDHVEANRSRKSNSKEIPEGRGEEKEECRQQKQDKI